MQKSRPILRPAGSIKTYNVIAYRIHALKYKCLFYLSKSFSEKPLIHMGNDEDECRKSPHITKQIIRIFYQKETKSDIKRQYGTIQDKSRHCALPRYYLCIVNETHHRVTQSLTEDKFTIRRAKKKTPWNSVSSVVQKKEIINQKSK